MERRSQITVLKSFRLKDAEALGPRGPLTTHESVPVVETIEVQQFETTPAKVRVGFGLTLNRGNYESARIDVSVELPCYKEEVEEVYKVAQKFVEERIQAEVADLAESQKKALF